MILQNLAFPDYDHIQTQVSEQGLIPVIADHILLEFFGPEFYTGFRSVCQLAPLMPVPIASMHKDRS